MLKLVVRVSLPDRPGALGLVASRIGAIGADIVGVDVLERDGGAVVDEFTIALPNEQLVRLLVREIGEVDGASVEEWRPVETFPDPRLDALQSVEVVCRAASTAELFVQLAACVRVEFNADWAAVVRAGTAVAQSGDRPSARYEDAARGDVAVAPLPECAAELRVGRAGHPFRLRERNQLLALARIADRVATMLGGST